LARPRSDDRRQAILDAAIRVFAAQGLSAPTALIAKEAAVSNGSLFSYFPTKADLLNQLYVALKTEIGIAAGDRLSAGDDARAQLAAMWAGWLDWAAVTPGKRRTLALLGVADEISEESRQIGHRAMAGVAQLLDRCRADGPMRDAPLGFVASLVNAVAEATVDFIITDPENAARHRAQGFDAMWRMIS
jgi:AcrR family transcriptional regulator